ncbi:LysM peptidoglycan-binding domain-containing protein [Legionella impletisoli]|uniref:Signal peptidase n=1 Tax=Legionella impletisoli TaxID=343510 RepID=A0A917NDZ1_9GAMM|nr:LysM domain-containing protein [Legionella impletisoli]GGI88519.1 signal peptidase [Legionella impletisoli]
MRYLMFLVCFLTSMTLHAVTVLAEAPSRYVVQPGDTLWDIASRYLAHPWEWKTLWHANPTIKNPNRLYPGAVLELSYYQQNPYLKVLSNGTIKLSPYMRPMPLEEAIPPIPLSEIRSFLDGSLVLDKDSLSNAPYIVAFTKEHLLGGQGDEVYVKDLCPSPPPPGATFTYGIYRPCGSYQDPETNEFLGYKAILVGYGELVQGGDPAVVMLTDIMQGVEKMDRVMPNNYPGFDISFEPKAPNVPVKGQIIDLPGDYTQGAVGLVVVLNRGKNSGLQAGDVLGVYSPGRVVPNPKCPPNCVELPPERLGEVMVFRTFSCTSFALVVRSTRAVRPMDVVTNP